MLWAGGLGKRAMKITMEIDCTPEEARRFFGLPDVRAAQEAVMAEVEARMREFTAEMDPETIMKTWFSGGIKGWEELQRAFWDRLGKAGGGGESTS